MKKLFKFLLGMGFIISFSILISEYNSLEWIYRIALLFISVIFEVYFICLIREGKDHFFDWQRQLMIVLLITGVSIFLSLFSFFLKDSTYCQSIFWIFAILNAFWFLVLIINLVGGRNYGK